MVILRKISLIIISLAILAWVLYFVEPPKSWPQASYFQILAFFLPLVAFFTFVANLFLNYLPRSFVVGLGLMMVVVLKAIDQLNAVTVSGILIVVAILVTVFKKPTPPQFQPGLTRQSKIPKLKNLGREKGE